MSVHICTSTVQPAKPGHLHRVCGVCWFVRPGCRCFAVDDLGTVMRENRRQWSAWRGDDLMDRQCIGAYRTRREAVAALREEANR